MAIQEVRAADGIVITCQLSGGPGAPAMVLLHAQHWVVTISASD
jgi:hypothetical protein